MPSVSTSPRRVVVPIAAVVVLGLLAAAVLYVLNDRRAERSGTGPSTPVERAAVVDHFDRQVSGGWGAATLGGSWTGVSPGLTVADGVGRITMTKPGSGTAVMISPGSSPDVEVKIMVTAPSTTSPVFVTLGLRSANDYDYRAALLFRGTDAFLTLSRQDGAAGRTLVLGKRVRIASGVEPGQQFHMVFAAFGTSPVSLSASATRDRAPTTAQISATDESASRILSGGDFVLNAYLSRSATAGTTVSFDDLEIIGRTAG